MAFEAAFDLARCLAFDGPSGGVALRLGVVGETGEGDRVQGAVELAVAVEGRAMIVARCSVAWLRLLRKRAQRASCRSLLSGRSCWRSWSGALTISAFSCPIAFVRAMIAPSRVMSKTRSASRSPRRRGW